LAPPAVPPLAKVNVAPARADTLRVEANSPGATPEEENTVAVPTKIVPREDKLVVPAAAFPLELAPWSMNVLRIPVK
jgi:hypothetical protein